MRHLVLIFVFALLVAACGGEQIAEQIAEQAIGGDADVDISEDGDEVTVNIESDEGSITIGGGEVPDEITIPIPNGGDVTSSLVVGTSASVGLNFPNNRYDELVALYDDMVANSSEAGWQVTEQSIEQSDGLTMRTKSWASTETVKHVIVRDCYSLDSNFEGPFDSVCLDINESADS